MTFGALEPCEVCKGGQYVFNKIGYVCQGDLTEWTKCNNVSKEPKRRPFVVPADIADAHPFLKNYKPVVRKRIFKEVQPTGGLNHPMVKKEKDDPDGDKPKVERALPALYNMEFVILGKPKRGKEQLKKDITRLGGKVVTKIQDSVMAVFASAEDVEKMGSRMRDVQTCDIHVVPEEFVDEAKDNVGKIPDLIIKKSISSWGSDVSI